MNERNFDLDNYALILPSLNPTDKLEGVVKSAIDAGFANIVLVDDGSSPDHKAPFARCACLPGVTVLSHEVNRGKGAALKTAFAWLQSSRPDILGAVTADGDGQHLAADILRCTRALYENPGTLIMGCRNFDLPHVPEKSKKGNKITSFIFRTGCGIRLSDTQTGLRAVGREHFPALLEIGGERYEYETNMLLEFHRRGIPFTEVEIETVYEDNNSGSHFRPVRDSLRIYKLIIKYMLSSGASAIVDLAAFWLFHRLLGGFLGDLAVAVCTVLARALSSFVNFNMNKKLVFGSRSGYGRAMGRYYILCVIQLCVSAALVWLLGRLFSTSASWLLTLLKALVDTALFFVSFHIQREWVFKEK